VKRLALLPLLGLLVAAPAARAQTTEGLGIPPATPPGQIEAKKLSKLPKQTKFVQADYPKEAADKGIEAEVVLLLDINAEGKVDSVGIAEPPATPGIGFEEAALAAAQQFEFEPAELDGKKIAVQITYRYKFKLAPKADAPPPAPAPEPAAPGAAPAAAPAAAVATAVRAPVVNFQGQLRERGTRLPLAGVLVTVFRDDPTSGKAQGFEATADESGRFQFFDLTPGEWKVLVEPPGFYPFRTTETIVAGEGIDVTYHVERGSYNPFDVTATATRPRKEVSRTVITAKEIDKVPGTFGDPLAVIQNFAGVARVAGGGQIIVRGSAPEDTRVFVDGAEVPLIYHFGGLRSVIPIGILDSIEFYPGNFSPVYGRATGGIIDVQLKKMQPKKVGGYADVSLLDTSVFLEVPLGDKGGIAVAGRRSYIDFILNAAVPDDAGVNLVTAPQYFDAQLLANYRPSPAHDLRGFFITSDDRLKLLFRNPAEVDPSLTDNAFSTSTTFYRSLLTYKFIPGPNFENNLRISQGRNWFYFRAGQLLFDINFYTTQMRDTVRQKFGERFTLTYGADVLYGTSDLNIRLPRPPKEGEPMGNFDFSQTINRQIDGQAFWSPAGFIEAEIKPWDGLLLLPGVRVDHFQRVHETVPQPRLTARLQLGERFTLKGGAGLFVQEPDFDETDPSFGNPDLKAERARHYSAGVEFKPRPWITLDATGFYKDLRNLVSGTDQVVMKDGVMKPLVYDNGGAGRVYGMELVARHEFTNNFTGWLAYTLSRSERTDSRAQGSRLFDFDQTHILTLVGSYVLPRNWQIGGRFRLVSGNPRTPIVTSTFNASTDRYDPVYGAVNSDRVAPFHQLDLRVDKRWVYQSWMLNLYLDIQNVYNRANPEGTAYNFNFRQQKPQQGLPIVTILGIRAEF
jgi:TonB family protein